MTTNNTEEDSNMYDVNDHLALLGCRAKGRVTGYAGVVTSLSYDLYGCIQVLITPVMNDKGELAYGNWFDVTRLEILSTAVMEPPRFDKGYIAEGRKGAAEKPEL